MAKSRHNRLSKKSYRNRKDQVRNLKTKAARDSEREVEEKRQKAIEETQKLIEQRKKELAERKAEIDAAIKEVVPAPIFVKSPRKMKFDTWYNKVEEAINTELAETGAIREMDFDSEKEFEKRYQDYLGGVNKYGEYKRTKKNAETAK